MGGCPNIVIALTDLQKGEEKAHACEIAWFPHPNTRTNRYNVRDASPPGHRRRDRNTATGRN